MTDRIVLVVDDDPTSLKRATSIMEKDYRVAAAISGKMAFKYLEKNTPDLILLDLNMPDMDGFEVMKKLREDPEHAKIPVIFLAAAQTPESEAQCLEAGAVDFVNKPFIPPVLKSRVKRIMELYEYRDNLEKMVEDQGEEIIEHTKKISEIQDSVIMGMANLIEERDNSTGHHVKNTQAYVRIICEGLYERGVYKETLTEEYRTNLIKTAPLHDVGKIKITDAILQKTGKLSEDEFRIMQNHTRFGADILEDILGGVEDESYLNMARDIALYHHERWDGNGYPEGLKGEDIPLCARIMAIADVFDALHEDRVYHRGINSIDKVLSIMEESSGTQFDPNIISVFLTLKDEIIKHSENEDKA